MALGATLPIVGGSKGFLGTAAGTAQAALVGGGMKRGAFSESVAYKPERRVNRARSHSGDNSRGMCVRWRGGINQH